MILWIRTKGHKGENGHKVASVEAAVEFFRSYKRKWDAIQVERNEKPYMFTVRLEDENDNVIMQNKELQALCK